jgi:signal transduction histidine kinase
MLALINAFVSHELRNPLNSIKAQNIEKKYIYEDVENKLKSINNHNFNDISDYVKVKILKLQNGMKVQERSVSLMTFIVQDLLDYA